jgi:hypothetical protein
VAATLDVPGGSSLAGIAYDPAADILYVSLGAGRVGVYSSASSLSNLSNPSRDIRLPSGTNIFDLTLDAAGDVLYVANNGDFRVDIVRDCDTRNDAMAAPADANIPIDLADGQILGVHLPASNTNHLFVSTTSAVLGFSNPNGTPMEVQNLTGFAASDCFVGGTDLYVAAFAPANSVRRYANAFSVTGAASPMAIQSGNLQNTYDVFLKP